MNIFSAVKQKIQAAKTAVHSFLNIVKTRQWEGFKASVREFAAHPSLGTFVQMGRSGALLIGAVVALGVLTIVIPIVYLVSVQVGNTLPAGGLTNGQSSTLATLINNGGAALQLTTVSETVVGAGIILLGIYLFFQFRGR